MNQKVLILSLFFLLVMVIQPFGMNGFSLQGQIQSPSATPINIKGTNMPATSELQQQIGNTHQISQANSFSPKQSGQTSFGFNYVNGNYTTNTYLNSSYGYPGHGINFNTTSSYASQGKDWSTFGNYNNSYYYTLTSPQGITVYNSTPVYLTNSTQKTSSLSSANATGQAKITSYYNFSSVDFLTSISSVTTSVLSQTSVQINFTTNGRALGFIYYSQSPSTILSQHVSDRSYINGTHSLTITNLHVGTKYYFIVNATDIFGTTLSATNNGAFYTITTQSSSGSPVLGNLTVTINPNAVTTIAFTSSVTTNASIHYGTGTPFLSSYNFAGASTSFTSPSLPALVPATTYYFDIILNKTTFNNNGLHYNFTTGYSLLTGAYVNSGSIRQIQLNTSMERITFTTSVVTNATIIYGTTLSQIPSTHTQIINDSNIFTFYIPLDPTKPVTTYYYFIQLSSTTPGTIVDIDNNNNKFGIPYYNFTTIPSPPTNVGFINITVKLPVFPIALLGIWQFQLTVVKNITITSVKQPLIILHYASTFILNDTLTYNLGATYIQRGTTFNGTSKNIVPNYVSGYSTTSTFSPGDSGIFIGQIHYASVQSPINLTTMPINGTIDVVFNGVNYTNVGGFYSLPAQYVPINSSLTTAYNDNPTYILVNFTIPLANIYGSATLRINIHFPGNQTYSSSGYIQELQIPITVKYVLGITSTSTKPNYYYTQALNGSVTILPFIYNTSFFISNNYTAYNYSRFIPIPSNLLPVNVVQIGPNGKNESIAQVGSNNYTWSWLRPQIDFGIASGTHNITFTWSYGTQHIPLFTTTTSFTGNEIAYVYSYNINIDYGVNDLTKGIISRPGDIVTVRFQIVVPQTTIPITGSSYPLSPSVSPSNSSTPLTTVSTLNYSFITAEYSIQVKIANSAVNGIYYMKIDLANIQITGNNTLQITVNNKIPNPTTGFTTTNPIQDLHVKLSDYAIIGLAIIGFAAYVVVVLFYLRRNKMI